MSRNGMDRHHGKPALPEESPVFMPRRRVSEKRGNIQSSPQTFFQSVSTFLSRFFVLGVTGVLSVYGIREMVGVLTTNTVTALQWVFLILFSINFIWIAFAFSQALLGFLVLLKPRLIKQREMDPPFKTAILLPVYNEDPVRVRAAIEAMRSDLLTKAPGRYAFFILSDTNRTDAWIAEEQTFMDLVDTSGQGCPVYYRRRHQNKERKAGNIGDWVQRWGGDYGAMIVLDADSVMSADSVVTLSRRLAASPGVGLIQTLPTIVFADTLYGRVQQFANHCFGPVYAAGLSCWHGCPPILGHNAIIRTQAFAQSCHLPILTGKPPFGGHVLSHDFIEAALLRRAGWGVRFDTDIQTSFEQAPPSLIDVLVRDRRWCQASAAHPVSVCKRVCAAHPSASSVRDHVLPERCFLVVADSCGTCHRRSGRVRPPGVFCPTPPCFPPGRCLIRNGRCSCLSCQWPLCWHRKYLAGLRPWFMSADACGSAGRSC